MRRRRPLGGKARLEVVDDYIHHSIIVEEGVDIHRAVALRVDLNL